MDKLDRIINIVRSSLYEEVPMMNLGAGKIAGTAEADPDNPPVDLRKKRRRYWNPFFKDLAKLNKRKEK